MKIWVIKFKDDGEYLYSNEEDPEWGPNRKKAKKFKTKAEAFEVRHEWPIHSRKYLLVMRVDKDAKKEASSLAGKTVSISNPLRNKRSHKTNSGRSPRKR